MNRSPEQPPDPSAGKFASPIAIVGIGGIFPGAPTLEKFWQVVQQGTDTAKSVPPERWPLPARDLLDPTIGAPDKAYTDRGCFIENFQLDTAGLNIAPELAQKLDPMFQLLLHAGRAALRDSKITTADHSRTGVIIGNIALPTVSSSALTDELFEPSFAEKILGSAQQKAVTEPLNRYVAGLPAGVLAKALGLGAGAYTLDAACASSLYALKLACDELLADRADLMLTGGLSRPDCLYTQMGFSQLRALSPTGRCSPFDANGNGLVVGEGSGILVLQRLDDALRDGHHIYGVIRGIGLSNDIEGNLLAPSSEGQLRAMRTAYAQAGWTPEMVDLIECHATGTPVGDAVEFESLTKLWGQSRWNAGQCVLGAVKANIGHLLTGAGAAGLIKVLLAMKHQTLPPTANFSKAGEKIPLATSPFQLLHQAKPWIQRSNDTPRRAAVSSFGFGGINAHVLVEEWPVGKKQPKRKSVRKIKGDDAIAIVGMDACFGPWRDLRSFQERVLGAGKAEAPNQRRQWWGIEQNAWFQATGITAPAGYYLSDLDVPIDRYRIPPKELADMLPQQLLMLQVAYGAMQDAQLAKSDSVRTGVYVGIGLDLATTNFHFRWILQQRARDWAKQLGLELSEADLARWTQALRDAAGPPLSANRTMGALGGIVASRLAREFRIGGPSHTISSEESSGIHALEAAVRALQQGEIDQALVGAVDLAGDIRSWLNTHAGRPYAANGPVRPFDADAEGTLPGEGATAVVVKRLADALRDGNRIYAVIRGLGTATGGGVESKIPTSAAYVAALERAYDDAAIDPQSIQYVETHGSGLAGEDAIEAAALTEFWQRTKNAPPRRLGSVKADIGHTGAAAGLASLVKASLCLYQEIYPPLRHLRRAREEFATSDFSLPVAPQGWLRNRANGPRRAAVSCFSVDGNCTHVVLEACEDQDTLTTVTERRQPLGARPEALFVVRGDDTTSLVAGLQRLKQFAENQTHPEIEFLARLWWQGSHADARCPLSVALVARDRAELQRLAESAARTVPSNGTSDDPQNRDRIFYSAKPLASQGRIAFVFPGSGNHYADMGRELALQWPEILREQDKQNQNLAQQMVADWFWNGASLEKINHDHCVMIFGQVALGTVVSDLVQKFGVKPGAVIGYSLGESAGLFSLHAWKARDVMLRRMLESTLFTRDLAGPCDSARKTWKLAKNAKVDWGLGVVDRSAAEVRTALADRQRVYLLIVNTPGECIIGGDRKAVEQAVKDLGCRWFPLQGVTTVHCDVAQVVAKPYHDLHLFDTTPPPGIKFYSGNWGRAYELTRENAADSILAQALEGVDYPKVIQAAYADGVRLFLEMGPGGSCSRMIGRILENQPHLARSACVSGSDSVSVFLRFLAQLIAEGVPVNLDLLYGQPSLAVGLRIPKIEDRNKIITVPVGGKPFEVPLPPFAPARPVTLAPVTVIPVAPVLTAPARSMTPEPAIVQPQPRVAPLQVAVKPAPRPQEVVVTAKAEPVAVPAPRITAPISIPAPAAVPAPLHMSYSDPLIQEMAGAETATQTAHEMYLRLSENMHQTMSGALAFELSLLQSLQAAGGGIPPAYVPHEGAEENEPPATPRFKTSAPVKPPTTTPRALDREQCMEFAIGKIGNALGAKFAQVDQYPTRVRLPDEPLMLVDRILEIEGEPCSMTHGRVVTEHDIHPGAWYLDCGRIPTCIAVEAGQADLFLSGFLGIDFETRGLAVYRLLDAKVTFHRGLPGPGEVIHYNIRIENFFKQGHNWLFRFSFEGTVNGEPLLTMREGCAGFFTAADLAAGKGVVQTTLDKKPLPGKRPADWETLVPMDVEAYDDRQIDALRRGDFAACFGERFAHVRFQKPVTLPSGKMQLVDRVVHLDPNGGRFGMGLIRAEADIQPNDWFITCHFIDDRVMPGTLMFECCLHTLRIFLFRMGWVTEQAGVALEPVTGIISQLKCRGQVIESTKKVTYEITLKEVGYRPEPYAVCDALMYADGKPIVEITNMSLRFTGVTREGLKALWQAPAASADVRKPAIYDQDRILAYAIGKPSYAFGEPYKIFDEGRILARLPGPPYLVMDRVTAIDCEPWKMIAGGTIEAQYDVPPDAWYFAENRQGDMPFAVLLEIALQPCGWLAAYVGSALTSPIDVSFRNLGGTATQFVPVFPDVGTLTVTVKITKVSTSGGMIIQNFDYEVRSAREVVYRGDTYFGFFSKQALSQQEGIRKVNPYKPTEAELARAISIPYPTQAPYPGDMMRMVDAITCFVPDGGPKGLGFIRGTKRVDASEWFFKAHFYQDPVVPGSLGLESFLQLLRHVAIQRWGLAPGQRVEAIACGEKHEWVYRGQIIPTNREATVEAAITAIDDERRMIRAEGFLHIDGRTIYGMKEFTVAVR